ncbi:MAG: DNA-binding protein [Proteobacteria bacterium]|nr:DNA-binding protein [Pseudomonadota bacterium]NOG60050.1 DNA-binding protein [Pseudomonadota bacterium]
MPQKKLLLDSNSYFRLAKSIHPLLDVIFGDENYCLYVLKELDGEYDKNSLLRKKFSWVEDDEYFDNRKKRISVSRAEKKDIDLTVDYLVNYKVVNGLGVSKIDIKCLAQGYVQNIPVVTDDQDMLELAKSFYIVTMTTLELMSLMHESGHITMGKVGEIVAYWEYVDDKPANFRKDYKKLFGKYNKP